MNRKPCQENPTQLNSLALEGRQEAKPRLLPPAGTGVKVAGQSRRRYPFTCPQCGKTVLIYRHALKTQKLCSPKCGILDRIPERFWKHVLKTEGCWLWTASRKRAGYGNMGITGSKETLSHRISWIIHNGKIPDGMFVLHKCDNPPCVRPDHLFLGTNADNMADMVSKKRARSPIGEQASKAKLKTADILAIRTRAAAGEATKVLAAVFGVRTNSITNVTSLRTWNHVP